MCGVAMIAPLFVCHLFPLRIAAAAGQGRGLHALPCPALLLVLARYYSLPPLHPNGHCELFLVYNGVVGAVVRAVRSNCGQRFQVWNCALHEPLSSFACVNVLESLGAESLR